VGAPVRKKAQLHVSRRGDGALWVQSASGSKLFSPRVADLVVSVIEAIDGQRTDAEIVSVLDGRVAEQRVRRVLATLSTFALVEERPARGVVVLSNGPLGASIVRELAACGFDVHAVPGFLAALPELSTSELPIIVAAENVCLEDLRPRSSTRWLPVLVHDGCLTIGPIVSEDSAIGLDEVYGTEALPATDLRFFGLDDLDSKAPFRRAIAELASGLENGFDQLAASMLRAEAGGVSVLPLTVEDLARPLTSTDLETALRIEQSSPARRPGNDEIRTVGVIGGGTAGYFAALALAKKAGLDVTIVESKDIPVIGVGEATTPPIVRFLFDTLAIPPSVLYRSVTPTWKLGIRFEWGLPAPHAFPNPFGAPTALTESIAYEGHTDASNLNAVLMKHDRAPLIRDADGQLRLLPAPYAFHLDNAPLVALLEQIAETRRIRRIEATVHEVRRAADGRVVGLSTSAGDLQFDLYVDCTGFASRLLGDALKTPFVDYGSTLFTDAAVTGRAPNHGSVSAFTRAITMRSGWCWRLPLLHEDHLGYVFSSSACSTEEAWSELRALEPHLEPGRRLSFRTGRHESFWVQNVAAIGNAYGFVEPLESTGLHMIIAAIEELLARLPSPSEADRNAANHNLGSAWDSLRWFLGLHYKLNRRLETPFWQRCRRETNIEAIESNLDLFARTGPLSSAGVRVPVPDDLFGTFGTDFMLAGMQAPHEPQRPHYDRDRWNKLQSVWQALASSALESKPALDQLKTLDDGSVDRLLDGSDR
jgi:tryptophan halogenase